jgi:hypothetical protein
MNDPMLKVVEKHTVKLSTGQHKFVILPGGQSPPPEKMEEMARAIHARIRNAGK